METIKTEFKQQFNITLTDEQAQAVQVKRQLLTKTVETVETVQYWGCPKMEVTKINGVRI